MAYEPLMDGKSTPNVYDEHVFKVRVTFGATSTVTFRSKDATIAKTTTTTFTVTLPKPYAEITDFSFGWAKATGADPLAFQITTNNIATDGTLVLTTVSTNSAGVATAPAQGDVAYITLGASCATLNSKFTG